VVVGGVWGQPMIKTETARSKIAWAVMIRICVMALFTLLSARLARAADPPHGLPKVGTCAVVRGRLAFYNGGSPEWVWAVGTHHMYWIEDGPPNIEKLLADWDHVLYADFLLCPTTPYKDGYAQGARIKELLSPRLALRR
jgi:hypothetical protein